MAPRTLSTLDQTKLTAAIQTVLDAYQANGHVRHPVQARMDDADKNYRKGWEARIGAADDKAAVRIVQALKRCGYMPGTPYKHGNKIRVPLYGFEQVSRFVTLINS